jgi:hypothetical protein
MPSTTTNSSRQHHSALSRVRGWRPLAKGQRGRRRSRRRNRRRHTEHAVRWRRERGHQASLVKTPVQAGYATTPVLNYTSYAQFSSDIASGAIKYPYKWVMYDPENWASTPAAEAQDPVKYLKLFGQLAQAHGFKVAEAPSLDLCSVSGTLYPRQAGESCVQWYGRINVAGAAATGSDIYILQDESNTTNLNQYASLYATSASQARAANSAVKVYSEVSTANGTPDQMTAAAESISPDGFYVAAPGAIPQVDQFFQNLKTAGY